MDIRTSYRYDGDRLMADLAGWTEITQPIWAAPGGELYVVSVGDEEIGVILKPLSKNPDLIRMFLDDPRVNKRYGQQFTVYEFDYVLTLLEHTRPSEKDKRAYLLCMQFLQQLRPFMAYAGNAETVPAVIQELTNGEARTRFNKTHAELAARLADEEGSEIPF